MKEIVLHVMERLKNLDQVQLPMEALFLQCQSQQTEEPTLVRALSDKPHAGIVLVPVTEKSVDATHIGTL